MRQRTSLMSMWPVWPTTRRKPAGPDQERLPRAANAEEGGPGDQRREEEVRGDI